MKLTEKISKHAHALELAVIGIIIASLAINLSDNSFSTITGFVTSETHRQSIDLEITRSGSYQLTTLNGTPPQLTHFAVTGTITGNGTAALSLQNNAGRQLLVHSNLQKLGTTSLLTITGAFTKAPTQPAAIEDNTLIITPGRQDTTTVPLPDGYRIDSTPFENTCIETCIIDPAFTDESLTLRAAVEPGTQIRITDITYTTITR